MMKKVLVILFVAVLLAGCGGSATPAVPTASVPVAETVAPTATSAPTATAPAVSDATEKATSAVNTAPTPKPMPTMEIKPGSPYSLNESGFSFRSVEGVIVQLQPPQAILSTIDQLVFFSLAGDELKDETDPMRLFADFIGSIQQNVPDLEASDPASITVGGVEGLVTDLSGTMSGGPFRGQAVLVVIDGKRVFYASGVGMTQNEGDYWQAQGQPAFNAVLESIEFFEPKTGGDLCAVATDETYGTTKENPIRVGGDWLEGPYRERAYLDVLRGPNGEAITYERTGSENVGDVIVDVYQISGLAKPVTLYVDMYNFETLTAPAGFTCSGPIPLGAPSPKPAAP